MFIDHQKALKDLLAKDMNRKEFLMYMGGAVVGVIGITSFLENFLHQPTKKSQQAAPTVIADGSYGGGGYSASSNLQVRS
jgi:hypothetical protein